MTPNEQFDESMKLAIEKQMSSDTMLPRKEYTPVTRTIEEFMSTNFSKEEYAKLEFLARSRDSSLVQRGEGALNAKLIESFNRKYLAQTGFMYHFAPKSARKDIEQKGIKLTSGNDYKVTSPLSGRPMAWFSPTPTMFPSMIDDLLIDRKRGLDVYRVKTTPTILSRIFIDPNFNAIGYTGSKILDSFEASGKSEKGINFLLEYMKGVTDSSGELTSNFQVPISKALAFIGDQREGMEHPRIAAELFIPGVTDADEFQSLYDAGAKNFEEVLRERISVKSWTGPNILDKKLSERTLAKVSAAKSESIKALEGIDAVTTTSAKLTPKTFNKIIKSGDVAASVMRFVKGL